VELRSLVLVVNRLLLPRGFVVLDLLGLCRLGLNDGFFVFHTVLLVATVLVFLSTPAVTRIISSNLHILTSRKIYHMHEAVMRSTSLVVTNLHRYAFV
jgi:hypothetical protein